MCASPQNRQQHHSECMHASNVVKTDVNTHTHTHNALHQALQTKTRALEKTHAPSKEPCVESCRSCALPASCWQRQVSFAPIVSLSPSSFLDVGRALFLRRSSFLQKCTRCRCSFVLPTGANEQMLQLCYHQEQMNRCCKCAITRTT
eukprot:scaffold97830_cov19-Tisochrysis_lutea.AAC.1